MRLFAATVAANGKPKRITNISSSASKRTTRLPPRQKTNNSPDPRRLSPERASKSRLAGLSVPHQTEGMENHRRHSNYYRRSAEFASRKTRIIHRTNRRFNTKTFIRSEERRVGK